MKICFTHYSYVSVPPPVVQSLMGLTVLCAAKYPDAVLQTRSKDALISRSRSRQTALAINTNADVWVQLDHDIEFQAQDIIRLCEIALERKAAVCVPYSCRSLPPKVAFRGVPPFDYTAGADEVKKVALIATGCCAIPIEQILQTLEFCDYRKPDVPEDYKIHWIEELNQVSYPTLWKPMINEFAPGKFEYLSEDYSGSARMALAGVPQLAWTKPVLRHWGDYPFEMPH